MRFISALLVTAGSFGCNSSTNDKQREATERMTAEADREIGMPNITSFNERKILKRIYELRDQENLVMYAYSQSLDGQLIFLFKCMGYGVPYSAQFTNPMCITNRAGSNWVSLPQPEPNGIYSPHTSMATWLLIIDDAGKTHPVYVETKLVVSPVKIASAKGNPAN